MKPKNNIKEWIHSKGKQIPQEVLNKHFLLSVENNDELLELFLLLGADPNEDNNRAMRTMLERGNLENIKLLHKYGAEIDAALSKAIKTNQLEVVRYMLEAGADPEKINFRDALENLENIEMLKLILQHNIQVNGYIMQQAIFTSVDIVKLLLQHTGGKFPKGTFNAKSSYWGHISNIPADVLEFVLHCFEHEPNRMSNLHDFGCSSSNSEFGWRLNSALDRFVNKADYSTIKLIIEFFKRNNKLFNNNNLIHTELPFISPTIGYDLVRHSKSINELNNILILLIENNLWSKQNTKNILCILAYQSSLETFKILGLEPNQKFLLEAIEFNNSSLVQELLNIGGIKPTKQHIFLAVKEYYSAFDGFRDFSPYHSLNELQEKTFEILEMLMKAK